MVTKSDMESMFEKYIKCLSDSIEASIERRIKHHISGLENRISELENQNSSLIASLNVLKSDMDVLREAATGSGSLVSRIDAIEKRISDVNLGSRDVNHSIEDVIAEVNDRQRRSSNVLFHGIEESSSSDQLGGRKQDEVLLRDAFTKFDFDYAHIVRDHRRLGVKKGNGTNRPILVTLADPGSTSRLLSLNRSMHPPPYAISADRTPRQRENLNRARRELQQRRDGGEADLTIKFVRGVPQVVPTPSSLPQRSLVPLDPKYCPHS
ncbi:unnamed protein product [Nesidiocoris tenuis]|uniref:Uncharacterized protein n=4 Tax=Nesidiocoris tenuis TaxID=355587 RepID=A0A6H5H3H3_9HEMI|nr:unnamed protein product [Nesidiocoris tenuis]